MARSDVEPSGKRRCPFSLIYVPCSWRHGSFDSEKKETKKPWSKFFKQKWLFGRGSTSGSFGRIWYPVPFFYGLSQWIFFEDKCVQLSYCRFAISHNNCIISCLPLASICERSECRTDYISFTSMGRPQEPFFKKYQMDLQKGLLQIFVYLERILESMQVSRSLDWKPN